MSHGDLEDCVVLGTYYYLVSGKKINFRCVPNLDTRIKAQPEIRVPPNLISSAKTAALSTTYKWVETTVGSFAYAAAQRTVSSPLSPHRGAHT